MKNPVDSQRCQELLQIFVEVFTQYGLERTTMLKLSQACGLTNAALVYYFRDMDNIIQQSAELALKQTEEVFVEEVTRSVADLEEMLLTFSHRIAERCGAKLRFVY